MFFGRSLFAGALVAGFISASGAAACSASISGAPQTSFLGNAASVATANAAADALRSAIVDPVSAPCTALAQAVPLVRFYLSGVAAAVAQCSSAPHASYFGKGYASASADIKGLAFRRFRSWAQTPARCAAKGAAEVFSYVYAYGSEARARAVAFGTTYYVGHGGAVAVAGLADAGVRTVGTKAHGDGAAAGSAGAINTAGGLANGHAVAALNGDAAVRRNGHRQFECFGHAEAFSSILPANTVVFQPQMAVARAVCVASGQHTVGLKAPGIAVASGMGVGVVGQTAVQGANAGNEALARGVARRDAFLRGAGASKAVARGVGKWKASARGAALTKAVLSSRIHLIIKGRVALAEAVVTGSGTRVLRASGVAGAIATCLGYNQVNDLVLAPAARTVRVILVDRELIVASESRLLAA